MTKNKLSNCYASPVYTAEQADKYVQNYQFARTKNLFFKKNKAGYYLVTILENKRLNMKNYKRIYRLVDFHLLARKN